MITKCQSVWMKGVLALAVLLHHLLLNLGVNDRLSDHQLLRLLVGQVIANLGVFAVGGFFFLAGNGLRLSYERKGVKYLYDLPRKRILPLYLIIGMSAVMYWLFWHVMGESVSVAVLLKTFGLGSTVIYYGWFLQAIMLLYVLFYFVFRITESYRLPIWGKALVLMIGYLIVCSGLQAPNIYWGVPWLFGVGIIWGDIYELCIKYRLRLLFFSIIIGSAWGGLLYLGVGSFKILYVAVVISSMSILFSFLHKLVVPEYGVIPWVGGICLELYIFQGAVFCGFRECLSVVDNALTYCVLTITSSLLVAAATHCLFKVVIKRIS